MQSIQLSLDIVKQAAVEIVKEKNQWKQNVTKIAVTHLQFKDCDVYLVQINVISSTMILSEHWPRKMLTEKNTPVIFAFRADYQTLGRGQRDNSWQSPQGNLYLTLLLKLQFAYFPYLPLIAISNVFKTVKYFLDQQKTSSITKIKWINDILINFQKVSGVIIKNEMTGQNLYTQIGIGINVKNLPQSSQGFSQSVTYLQKHLNKEISINETCQKVIETFTSSIYGQQLNELKSQSKKTYEQNLAYLNKDVLIYDYKYQKMLGNGTFKGINQYGHAILENNEFPFVQGRMKVHQSIL